MARKMKDYLITRDCNPYAKGTIVQLNDDDAERFEAANLIIPYSAEARAKLMTATDEATPQEATTQVAEPAEKAKK